MDKQMLIRQFPAKPRCCEWCERRGTQENPLTRLYVITSDMGPFKWWIHTKDCKTMLLEDPRVTSHNDLGGVS